MSDTINGKSIDFSRIKISVFIPSYNYGRFLPQAIESVLSQTFHPIEIVVVDDGSTDNTPEVVAQYGDKITLIRFDHRGIIAVRNAMMAKLNGDWILNLDADDWIEPQFLERAAALITAKGNPGNLAFVYADRVDFGAYNRKLTTPEFDAALFRKKNYVPFNALFRREIVNQYCFDPAFKEGWEDYDFLISLVKDGYSGTRLPEPPVHCRVHTASRTSKTFDADKMQRLMRLIVAKHSDFFTPEEAATAIEYFAPEAVMRHRICEHFRAKQYGSGLAMLVNVFFTHPTAIISTTVIRRLLDWVKTKQTSSFHGKN